MKWPSTDLLSTLSQTQQCGSDLMYPEPISPIAMIDGVQRPILVSGSK